MDRAVAIANEFLRRPGGPSLTQMQLQKLVYFAHGWNLAITGEPLTNERPEAWTYGPVYRDLYNHTKHFGSAPVGREIGPNDSEAARMFGRRNDAHPYRANLTPLEQNLISHVWSRYGHAKGASLSAMTHQQGTPWSVTFANGAGKNDPISNDLIRDHYRSIAQSVSGS